MLCHPYCTGCWQNSCRHKSETPTLLGLCVSSFFSSILSFILVWSSLLTTFSLFVLNSTERWLGTVRCAARGCCLARGFGRRSYPLFLSSSPRLLILVSSFLLFQSLPLSISIQQPAYVALLPDMSPQYRLRQPHITFMNSMSRR